MLEKYGNDRRAVPQRRLQEFVKPARATAPACLTCTRTPTAFGILWRSTRTTSHRAAPHRAAPQGVGRYDDGGGSRAECGRIHHGARFHGSRGCCYPRAASRRMVKADQGLEANKATSASWLCCSGYRVIDRAGARREEGGRVDGVHAALQRSVIQGKLFQRRRACWRSTAPPRVPRLAFFCFVFWKA